MSTTGWNFEKEYKVITYIDKENPIIIDIGAHKGESIKNFLKFKPNAIIYAFEPNPKLSCLLKEKYARNNAVKIFNLAVSTKSSLRLHIPRFSFYEFSGLSSTKKQNVIFRLQHFFNFSKEKLTFLNLKIKSKKLDRLNIRPDLIKIDTEGSEFDVVKSAITTIKKFNPLMIIEFNKNSYKQLNKIMKKCNYKPYTYQSSRNFKQIKSKDFHSLELERNLINIVYIPNKHVILKK